MNPALPRPQGQASSEAHGPFAARIRRWLFGRPRDLSDPSIFHQLSLIPFLAWVGLGADGLSSSAYGPAEAFLALEGHTYLAVGLALLTVITVSVISGAYSVIIRDFPAGGGGYVVATRLLGAKAGVVSGCALLVDYVLTITISVAAAGDALFSFLPLSWHGLKLPFEVAAVAGLSLLNLRGVREAVIPLVPVFLLFLGTHAVLLLGGILFRAGEIPAAVGAVGEGFRAGSAQLGVIGLLLVLARAWSLGGGTYTGIEAVSNGVPIMREPRVQTAQRTMLYMAVSLAVTAAGLLVCFLVVKVAPEPGKTLNAVLAERVTAGLPGGAAFTIATLLSEGALLVVAAQAGFIDGPRVLANMALDDWVPRRFASLSERLTTRNGILLMGSASLAGLLYTRGDVSRLVVMYSINVFLTFSLSMAGMLRAAFHLPAWAAGKAGRVVLFGLGLGLCVTILTVTVVEKVGHGGWVTLLLTTSVIALCFLIRSHYAAVGRKVSGLEGWLDRIPRAPERPAPALDPNRPTAALLVRGFNGIGIHTLLNVVRTFAGHYHNFVFVGVGTVDTAVIRSEDELESVRERTKGMVERYQRLAQRIGLAAVTRWGIGTDVVEVLAASCEDVGREFPNATFFAGQLIFERERWFHRFLHNQTAYALQKRLQWTGKMLMIMPFRVS